MNHVAKTCCTAASRRQSCADTMLSLLLMILPSLVSHLRRLCDHVQWALWHACIKQLNGTRALHCMSKQQISSLGSDSIAFYRQNYPGPGQIGGSAPDLAAGQAASRIPMPILNPGLARSRARAGSRAFAISVWLKKRREK